MSSFKVNYTDSESVTINYKDRRVAVKSYGYDDPKDKTKQTGYSERSVNESAGESSPLQVSLARFKLIEKIVKHDGKDDISSEDMAYAKTLKGSIFGGNNYLNQYKLTDITDGGSGRTIFTLTNGSDKCYVEIDFETDEEKAVRQKDEQAKIDEKNKKRADAQKAQEEKDAKMKEHQKNLKEDPVYRFIDKVMNKLGRPYRP